MKIRKNDIVLIISGKDKGKRGKVIQVFPKDKKLIVEGVNLVKKHIRPKKSGDKGQVATKPAFFCISNTKLICPKCDKAVRVSLEQKAKTKKSKSKIRSCKKCKSEF
ncbi:MAG: 50S ribosomal protein L24 [Candidatus Pacebacteria bacterium]|nr:50S ribosomal protein L24 [Candidatus Paceibacterota bacterium]